VNFGQYECRSAEEGIGSDWNTKRMVNIPGTGGRDKGDGHRNIRGGVGRKGEGNERSLSGWFSGLAPHTCRYFSLRRCTSRAR
jgi:hypothetical protein